MGGGTGEHLLPDLNRYTKNLTIFTLKMANAMPAETSDNSQRSQTPKVEVIHSAIYTGYELK
jgi:hypothetical protein